MAEGHPHANQYPLSKLWIETELVRERINAKMTTESTLMQAVIASIMSTDGGGADHLEKLTRRLNYGY